MSIIKAGSFVRAKGTDGCALVIAVHFGEVACYHNKAWGIHKGAVRTYSDGAYQLVPIDSVEVIPNPPDHVGTHNFSFQPYGMKAATPEMLQWGQNCYDDAVRSAEWTAKVRQGADGKSYPVKSIYYLGKLRNFLDKCSKSVASLIQWIEKH